MKKTLLFFFLLLSFFSRSQQITFCPPGATWHYYNRNDGQYTYSNGSLELAYTHTITLLNKVCKEVKGTFYGAVSRGNGFFIIPDYVTYRVYEENNVTYIFNIVAQKFDTIADFNAKPGDSWFYALKDSWCDDFHISRNKVTVYDTGHVTINNFWLKQLVISPPAAAVQYAFIERIGGFPGYFAMVQDCQQDGSTLGNFSCYQDDSFPLYKVPSAPTCTYNTIGQVDLQEQYLADGVVSIYPNPSNGQMKLDLQQPVDIVIFNALGATIFEQHFESAGYYEVDISAQAGGIYYLRAGNTNGVYHTKLLKQ